MYLQMQHPHVPGPPSKQQLRYKEGGDQADATSQEENCPSGKHRVSIYFTTWPVRVFLTFRSGSMPKNRVVSFQV
jgi:hypothetical protein